MVARWPDGGWLEVSVDEGPPLIVSQDSPETAFDVRVPIARGLRRGQHDVHISAYHASVIDGFIVQDRSIWWLKRAVGGVAMLLVCLVALVWLMRRSRDGV